MNTTAQLLCDYLQNILRHPESASLVPDDLSADFQPLARVLSALQESLCRMTTQAKQIVEGDYDQRIDFIPDFSEAFNAITSQLQSSIVNAEMEKQVLMDSIQALDETSWELEKSNLELKNNLTLVRALTDYTNNMIFVYSVDSDQEVHINRSGSWFKETFPQAASHLTQRLIQQQPHIQQQVALSSEAGQPSGGHEDSVIWNMEVENPGNSGTTFYQVESFLIPWFSDSQTKDHDAKKNAVVHIVMDETERKQQQNRIYRLAYTDPLTKLNNRRYATEKMEQWRVEGVSFTLSFIDVDYLKYYNDTFGHERGDSYLIEISDALQTLDCEVCRVGGDEFILLQTDISPQRQDEKLELLRSSFQAGRANDSPKSFSYASTLVPAHTGISVEAYIQEADEKMYQYKLKNKLPLKDVLYQDERL